MDNDHVAPQAVWLDNAYDGFDDPGWASIDTGPVLGRAPIVRVPTRRPREHRARRRRTTTRRTRAGATRDGPDDPDLNRL